MKNLRFFKYVYLSCVYMLQLILQHFTRIEYHVKVVAILGSRAQSSPVLLSFFLLESSSLSRTRTSDHQLLENAHPVYSDIHLTLMPIFVFPGNNLLHVD